MTTKRDPKATPAKKKTVTGMANDWTYIADVKACQQFRDVLAAWRQRNRIPGKPQVTEAALNRLRQIGEEHNWTLTAVNARKVTAHIERA
jgi:hypothetical protein